MQNLLGGGTVDAAVGDGLFEVSGRARGNRCYVNTVPRKGNEIMTVRTAAHPFPYIVKCFVRRTLDGVTERRQCLQKAAPLGLSGTHRGKNLPGLWRIVVVRFAEVENFRSIHWPL